MKCNAPSIRNISLSYAFGAECCANGNSPKYFGALPNISLSYAFGAECCANANAPYWTTIRSYSAKGIKSPNKIRIRNAHFTNAYNALMNQKQSHNFNSDSSK
ncbi:hypothetical protein [Okeania sp. SIO2B3]|uniref:hypothetical protein n=1 Tax=Okeania sp. SIO2B3 TaxID=2607784 RepID=UPI0013BFA31D|nr:hypothetical protein [Okeania sp. SIO2B3]NET42891.1 hypothetical protein [Okeania sp. SIO2B3]